ncbi:MAG: O-antigen ligase family protein [Gammaproteobacteria bacterium]|nr:O-antigen ligase family protein [Gammaproteobacteria bacterium]
MIRYTLLTLVILVLSVYAFRDWYRSLCGLLVLMAFIERYDMPRQMLGITGLNPWNVLIVFIVIAWMINARREQLTWDFSRQIRWLLFIYIAVVFVGFYRMTDGMGSIREFYYSTGKNIPTLSELFIDDLLNSLKYVVPGLLIFHGCNTRSRLLWGLGACLLASFFLGIQIIRWMPLSDLSDGDALSERALRVLDRSIGYHRVDLAAMMASASWAFFVSRVLAPNKFWLWTFTGIGMILILSLALTGGRTGYVSWAAVALLLSALRWRKLVLAMPILVLAVVSLVPAVRDRMFQGFGEQSRFESATFGDGNNDYAAITSDRILIWPSVIGAIGDAPLFGYGRKGFFTSGASLEIRRLYPVKGKGFPHPHNAYLEFLIDNGLVGALPVFWFFFVILKQSAIMFRDKDSPLYTATGGIALAYIAGQLVASIGAQSFYPRAGVVIMWAVIGLAMRAYIMREKDAIGSELAPIVSDNRRNRPTAARTYIE